MAIKNFTDLEAWKFGHRLALQIYKTTRDFPKYELFALTDQIRRAAVSVTSNIAEGFGRNYPKDRTQFYIRALGSLYEVQNQIILSLDLGYINSENYKNCIELANTCAKVLNGLIKSTKSSSLPDS